MRTYGEILYYAAGKAWHVQCEPQVTIRLKRLFGRVKQRSSTITIMDTAEVCRDLEWFMERYPLKMSDADRAMLSQRATRHRELTERIGQILGGEYRGKDIPLALPLRPYQAQFVDLASQVKRLINGDEVGLGKTAQAIGVLADPSARPALVVTLAHVQRQWKAEIERFLPGSHVHILKTTKPYDLARPKTFFDPGGLPDFVVCNYHKLDGWSPALAPIVRGVVFDECQELRHSDSAKYAAAEAIARNAEYCVGLSATPIYNKGIEMFNIMNVVSPGTLGTRSEFEIEWCNFGGNIKEPQAFGSYLREQGMFVRRTREEVGRELPDLVIAPHVMDVDSKEIDKVAADAVALAKSVLSGGSGFDKLKASEELSWKLRHATGIAKAPYVAEFVRMLVEGGERVLLAGWHHDVYDIWREKLKDVGVVSYTGDETLNEKDAAKKAFIDGDAKVLLMSLRAGAGVDGLQHACRTVVIGELDWSPSQHEQFIGRIYRDGQKDQVIAYFPLADSGSDPVIADVLGIKRAQLDGIRDPNADLVQRSQQDPERIKMLAQAFLKQRGVVFEAAA